MNSDRESDGESFYNLDQDNKITALMKKVKTLEEENQGVKERIKKITIEIKGSKQESKVFKSIST